MIQVAGEVDRDVSFADDLDNPVVFWRDVATVSVPARTKRKTALRQGLAEAGVEFTPDLRARALDSDSAYVWVARPKQDPALELQ